VSKERKDAAAAVARGERSLTHREIVLILVGLMSGMFLSALDQSVVGSAMRTIADDLKGLDLQAWVTTAYLITSTITTPIYGKLGDIFGRRRMFIIAVSIFIAGSVLCGFATDMPQLAAYRAFQGLGAGGLFSLALTIMADIVPPRERAKYMGMFMAVFATSSVLGPLVGGLFAGANEILWIGGWRWVFLINLPIGVVALFMVLNFLHVPHHPKSGRIDWWGAFTIIFAVTPLLIIAEQGRDWGWWSWFPTNENGDLANPGSIPMYVVSVVGIVAFILVEKRMKQDALLPLSLFKSSTFTMSTILGVVVGAGMFGGMMTIPLILQIVYGATPTESGFLMLPMVVGMMTASILSGRMTSKNGKYKRFMISGTTCMTIAFGYMFFISADWQLWQMSIGMVVLGMGLGQLMQTLTMAAQNSVPVHEIGVATSAATFFRQMGGTLGLAVFLSILFDQLKNKIPTIFGQVGAAIQANPTLLQDPNNAAFMPDKIAKLPGLISTDASFLSKASHELAHPIQQGYAEAASVVFGISAIVMVSAIIIAFFVKEVELRQVSGVQARAEEAEAKMAALG